MLIIRPATIDDLPDITDIYNEAVRTTDATFDIEPKTVEERTGWFNAHDSRHPILVAAGNSTVIGWASLSKWSERLAYADTAEISVYVKDGFRRKGAGRKLMETALDKGREAGLHAILSRIVAGNQQSIRLHESLGFEHVGVMREVGRKFGRLLDVAVMQKIYPSS
jgi:phosphinothricin acetyltransferase